MFTYEYAPAEHQCRQGKKRYKKSRREPMMSHAPCMSHLGILPMYGNANSASQVFVNELVSRALADGVSVGEQMCINHAERRKRETESIRHGKWRPEEATGRRFFCSTSRIEGGLARGST
ncbi:unnamed protein product [Toxocara canis]|uniref:Transposase n=1 Tax=Toxocara canis TaxID=6265 RepID=A0A183UYY9_TOXCA|nr:unnamed protein product [Toxocara canis]